MPLKRKTQVAVAVEDYPNAPLTLAGTDVIETVEPAQFSGDPELLTREPSGGTLSKAAEAVGRHSGQITFPVDFKGSGTATTEPRWGRLVLAALARKVDIDSMALSVALTNQLEPGDVLTGGTSGATAIVTMAAAAAATTIRVVVLSGTFSTAEQINSAQKGANVGTTHAATVITAAQGVAYRPVSDTRTTMESSNTWSGSTPAAGAGLAFVVGTTVVGEGHMVSWSAGTPGTLTVELAYGEIPDGCDVEAADGSTLTLDSPANVETTQGKSVKARCNLDKLVLDLTAARVNFQITADAGATGRIAFTVQGQPVSPTEAARLTPSGLATTTPPRFAGGVASIGGLRLPTKSVAFDAGSGVVQIADANSSNGEKGGDISGREPTMTMSVEQASLAGIDLFALRDAGTTVGLGFQLGTTAGNRPSVVAPAAQITGISFGDDNGVATLDVTFALRRLADTGDDEWFVCLN